MCNMHWGTRKYSIFRTLAPELSWKGMLFGCELDGRIILDWILRVKGRVAAHWIGLAYQASVVALTDLQVL